MKIFVIGITQKRIRTLTFFCIKGGKTMETIAAISTAMGEGGIGIVRISGPQCFTILDKIFIAKNPETIENIPGYTIKYGKIVHPRTGKTIDEVLVSYFKAPRSYTTEDMCEINSHGGTVVLRMVLEACLQAGASLAEPGEFTKRAFLNGRIDLSQAESIIDLIQAKSEKEAQASAQQLEGRLSKKIKGIQAKLLDFMADIEASIDYPEYDIEEVTNPEMARKLEEVSRDLANLEKSFETGKILKEGIKTVIIGRPNAGKSSLLNAILQEERAIVSDIAGTTRDTIEEMITVRGVPLKLIDTAGIRKTEDEIEKIGVERALKLMKEAELVIHIIDGTEELTEEDQTILSQIQDKNALVLLNKIDQGDSGLENDETLKATGKKVIKISAKLGDGIEEMYQEISKMFQLEQLQSDSEVLITNIRHKNQIHNAWVACEKAKRAIMENMPIDLVAVEIKEILEAIGEITGDQVSDDIINEIFHKFCLGK